MDRDLHAQAVALAQRAADLQYVARWTPERVDRLCADIDSDDGATALEAIRTYFDLMERMERIGPEGLRACMKLRAEGGDSRG